MKLVHEGWFLLALGLAGACGGRSALDAGSSAVATAGTAAHSGSGAAAGSRNGDGAGGSSRGGASADSGRGGRGPAPGGHGGVTMAGAGGTSGGVGGGLVGGVGGVGATTGGTGAATSGMANSEGGESAGAGGMSGSTTGGSAGEGGSQGTDCIVRVAETGSDSDDGSDWSLALRTVQRGIDVADDLGGACSTIDVWVAAGTYVPTWASEPADPRTATFRLVSGVHVYGGFAGVETARAERNVAANVTVLSGDVGTPGDQTDNVYHVVTGVTAATLDGFTITGGWANGDGNRASGAGMYNATSSPTVTDCTFTHNFAGSGGGMYNRTSEPVVTGCTFTDNGAVVGDGGGMQNDGGAPYVSGCTFSNNDARYSGGAMSNENGAWLTIDDCSFTGNGAVTGGAVYDDAGSASVITNSTFAANEASYGGALFANGSAVSLAAPSVTNSIFTNNSAYTGGAIYADWQLMVTNSTFFGNAALGTEPFTGNAYASGGAIYAAPTPSSRLVVTNGTFYRNAAEYAGGGIYSEGGFLEVANTILWNDSTPAGASEIDFFGSVASVSSSIIEGGYAAGVNISTSDPAFVDPDTGNFQLGPSSPAIDACDVCAGATKRTDQSGNGRWDIAAVPNVSGPLDCGALEYQGVTGVDTPLGGLGCL